MGGKHRNFNETEKFIDTYKGPAIRTVLSSVTGSIDSSNPLPTAPNNALSVTNSIDETAYDLNAASFSEVTTISNDYIFDSIEFNFSTDESKTITITTADGTAIYSDTNIEQNIFLSFDRAFNGGENLTVTVTQFSSVGTMDCILKVKQGGSGLVGNPVLGTGTNHIGSVTISSPLESNGAIPVNIQDQHSEILEFYLQQIIDPTLTIFTNTSINDTVVTVSTAAEPTNGSLVCFREDTHFYQAGILSHVANGANWDVTLDTPLDFAFTTGGGCALSNKNMAVDGDSTSVEFEFSAEGVTPGTEFDITGIIFHIIDNAAMDTETFGGIPKLTKGIVLRVENTITKNIFNVKSNGDFADHIYDVAFDDKAPAGAYSFRCRKTFAGQPNSGVTVRLNTDTSDKLVLIVQDDLTDLTDFHVVVQGHVVVD